MRFYPCTLGPETHAEIASAGNGERSPVKSKARAYGIGELGLLSNCRSAALVDRGGSIVWWCPERFDSDSWFGLLLDPDAGVWSLQPEQSTVTSRRYLPGTLVIETTFSSPEGTARLTAALLFASGTRGKDVGAASPAALARQ